MNAIQPSKPLNPPAISGPTLARRRSGRKKRPNPYTVMATETSVKLAVNMMLSVVAISALVQLLPHNRTGQEKLQQIQAEVQQTETRVNQLQAEFNRSFDPQQVKTIMQEQSHRVDPTQLRVIWLEKRPAGAAEPSDPEPDREKMP